ncbi:hypothetical protein BDW60DRAFT_184435 [Aspergillus nidulans var. acristatus]
MSQSRTPFSFCLRRSCALLPLFNTFGQPTPDPWVPPRWNLFSSSRLQETAKRRSPLCPTSTGQLVSADAVNQLRQALGTWQLGLCLTEVRQKPRQGTAV